MKKMRKVLKAIILSCLTSYVVSCGRPDREKPIIRNPMAFKSDLIVFDVNWKFVDFIKDERITSTIITYDDNSYSKVGVFSDGFFSGYITPNAYAICQEYITTENDIDLLVYKEIVK